jgi:hypothetical protein
MPHPLAAMKGDPSFPTKTHPVTIQNHIPNKPHKRLGTHPNLLATAISHPQIDCHRCNQLVLSCEVELISLSLEPNPRIE